MFSSIKYEFIGFEPEAKVKRFIKHMAERIKNRAPSGSILTVQIKKYPEKTGVTCKVLSEEGIFFSDKESTNPVVSAQRVEKDLKNQIRQWQKNRFQPRKEKINNVEFALDGGGYELVE